MDVTEYFQIVSSAERLLHVKVHGFWIGPKLGQAGWEALEQFKRAVDEISAGGRFILLVDLCDLPVMTPEVKDIANQAVKYSRDHGQYKAVEIIPRAIVLLGILETMEKLGLSNERIVVKSHAEANRVVEQLKRDLGSADALDLTTSTNHD